MEKPVFSGVRCSVCGGERLFHTYTEQRVIGTCSYVKCSDPTLDFLREEAQRASRDPSLKLWDPEHPYYCSSENYHVGGPHRGCTTMTAWSTFVDYWASEDADDLDLNLLFRWDWDRKERTLKLYFMQQRRGNFVIVHVHSMVDDDEPSVRAWLQPRWERMKDIWEPLSGAGV